MPKDNRETLIRKLLKELPELLADYEHLAPDADGRIDATRRARIRKISGLLVRIKMMPN